MQRGDDRVDVRPVGRVLVGFLFKGAAPSGAKIAQGSLVKVAAWIGKIALQKGGFHALDVDVQAQVFAVYCNGGKVAARRGQASGREDAVRHARIDHRRVLLDVVQGQTLHRAAEELAVDELVEADLERGFVLTQRPEEPFLADADLGVGFAIYRYRRLEPREHIVRRAIEAVGSAENIHEGPRLGAQPVPILGCHLNGHSEDAVEGKIGVASPNPKRWADSPEKRRKRDPCGSE